MWAGIHAELPRSCYIKLFQHPDFIMKRGITILNDMMVNSGEIQLVLYNSTQWVTMVHYSEIIAHAVAASFSDDVIFDLQSELTDALQFDRPAL